MDTVTFEDVAGNFTSAEWALLTPSQKKLYRDVMWETLMNVTAIGRTWDKQQMEAEGKIYSRNLRYDTENYLRFEEKLHKYNEHGSNCSVFWSIQKRKMRKTGEKPYQCGKFEEANLELSEQTHTGLKMFVGKKSMKAPTTPRVLQQCACKQCGKAFKQNCELVVHERIHTGATPYACKQWGKEFKQNCELVVHERSHAGEKPYACKQCGKVFKQKCECVVHEGIHTGEKPYVCKQCGKAFKQSGHLLKHERTHTGEKPYVCKQCRKCFRKSDSLRVHERIHTGEKPCVCKQCGKAFRKNGNLREHERIHTGEKPYVCKQCGKAFKQSGHLLIHERTHTG
ncbi:PREDICTED: zinc finger protein 239-like isoform X1 [Chinchilla lanigera]|uniref:zinc finger protein 239-like isoform X1 n=1 Tax=Chinchilla lanigera TaxID=34839 RepID=UPI00038EC01F|nr:PREDICTED: zinc finger protein 239-like isoform X1 [Chinchilla lanigera]XP_005401198.1 PREDICTED: zinc finger protein 239-like isoform X1 [Chinchilla lanigera]XP_005401199.1 PREDICTED: zinc finger protein 239-like isoform X1 [Chinchilla lanigera]XP_005401200.1 PREDICTED: zinc finger protein 239-like isoform X1 [Chinchilla lanigera]XP_013378452.1 PREDICTED: zinc finger protein 239-like isoform X1 [Chinchilla lanigera]XP_013378453.1 PREDICTED: zinc finger protein 239-like isoform X1 [Chinchil